MFSLSIKPQDRNRGRVLRTSSMTGRAGIYLHPQPRASVKINASTGWTNSLEKKNSNSPQTDRQTDGQTDGKHAASPLVFTFWAPKHNSFPSETTHAHTHLYLQQEHCFKLWPRCVYVGVCLLFVASQTTWTNGRKEKKTFPVLTELVVLYTPKEV